MLAAAEPLRLHLRSRLHLPEARLDEHRRQPGDERATPIWRPPPGTCSTSCTPLLLHDVHELYRLRESESRAAGDLAVIARAATFGAIDTVLVDIDEVLPGTIDDGRAGAIELAEADGAVTYGVVDEIAIAGCWRSGGSVLAVRREDTLAGEAPPPPSSATPSDPLRRALRFERIDTYYVARSRGGFGGGLAGALRRGIRRRWDSVALQITGSKASR